MIIDLDPRNWFKGFASGGIVPPTRPVMVGEQVHDHFIPLSIADKIMAMARADVTKSAVSEVPAKAEENTVSIKTWIINAEHTTAAWIEKELAKLVGAAPTLISIADATLTYVGPILITVLGATAGSATANAVSSVISQALTDLVVVRAVIVDAGPVPSAASMLTSIQTNLQGLLAAGHISDQTSVALVTKVLNEIATLLAAFPAAITPATPAAASTV